MLKRKTTDSKNKHDNIDYHGVKDHGIDVAYDNINRVNDIALSKSSWRVVLGRLYRHRGLCWAVVSICLSTAYALCVKSLAGKMAASQAMFFRGFAQVLFSMPHLMYYRVSLHLPLKTNLLLLTRASIGSLGGILGYLSYQALPVATAKGIIYSSPLLTGIFACVCLGERCSVQKVFFACLTVIAVTLVAQPPFIFGKGYVAEGKLIGIMCAVFTAVAVSLATIMLRYMQLLRIDAQLIIFIYGIFSMLCFGIMAVALGEWTNPQCGIDRCLVIVLATAGFLEQLTLTLALRTEPALVVSIIRTNDVFLSLAFDFLVFDIVPNALTIVGAILVVGSAIGMTVSANRENKRRLEARVQSEDHIGDQEAL